MRIIYSFLMYLLSPYLFLRLLWKRTQMSGYGQRIGERFGYRLTSRNTIDVWVHAVSLGEVIAVSPLIEMLLANQWRVLLTTMTPTGAQRAESQFGNKLVHQYVPYDLAYSVRQFFKKNKPSLGLIMETELWPNLIHFANKAGIPLLLINARLSQRSCQGYQKFRSFFKPTLNQFNAILTQTEADAKRFIRLGADENRVQVLGNMKFDLQTKGIESGKFLQLKKSWGKDRVALILASTHEDEEAQVLSFLKLLQENIPGVILLIAPRHPERFQKVYQLSLQLGFNTGLRSKISSLNTGNEVVILDSTGELLGFYSVSDYAFVGGSLVPIGGHNVLEPIAMGVPVLSGLHIHNFQGICHDLQQACAVEFVATAKELVLKICDLHRNPLYKKQLVDRATFVLQANKGAVARYYAEAASLIKAQVSDTVALTQI